jgi:hypothetical protein
MRQEKKTMLLLEMGSGRKLSTDKTATGSAVLKGGTETGSAMLTEGTGQEGSDDRWNDDRQESVDMMERQQEASTVLLGKNG